MNRNVDRFGRIVVVLGLGVLLYPGVARAFQPPPGGGPRPKFEPVLCRDDVHVASGPGGDRNPDINLPGYEQLVNEFLRVGRDGRLTGGGDGSIGWPLTIENQLVMPEFHWITDPVVIHRNGEMKFGARDMTFVHEGTSFFIHRAYRQQTQNAGGTAVDFGQYFHTNLRITVDEVDGEPQIDLGTGEKITFT
ncbi:MAG: hypothetical protein V3T70_02905, partial [Phycisphaerae bacterium]